MLGSKKYCCLQRIALPEAATHVASVGDRSAVNFMLKLSCFYFCKWLLPIQDVEIRQCTVTACSTTPVYCHSMQHTTSVLSQHAAHHQCTVTACSTPPVYCHSMQHNTKVSTCTVREMQTTLGKGQADLQSNSVLS